MLYGLCFVSFLTSPACIEDEGKESERESAQERVLSYFMFESQENLPDFVQHQLSGSLQSEQYCFPPCLSLLLSLYIARIHFSLALKVLRSLQVIDKEWFQS
jgi:hypothetical protein